MSHEAQVICYSHAKSWFNTSTHSWTLGRKLINDSCEKCCTDWRKQWEKSRRQWFQMVLFLWGFTIQEKLDLICLLNIFLMYNFELTWPCLTMSNQAQLYKKTNFVSLLILEILEFQMSFAIWSVKSIFVNNTKPEILPTSKLGWEAKYHNNFPFKLF